MGKPDLEGQSDNPECIGCHSTAYGEPEDLESLTQSNILRYKAIQCESCHGPLKGHPNEALTLSLFPLRWSDALAAMTRPIAPTLILNHIFTEPNYRRSH